MSDIDPQAFSQFEHKGWQTIAARYHAAFASITTQAVAPLLDVAQVSEGTRMLDVASGPGYVASAATARGAVATGIDFSSEMVQEARGRYPGIDFREGDAEAIGFPDATFEAVVTNFGLLHLARPEQAIREAYRVLRPGGRVAFTVWSSPDKTLGFSIVLHAIQKYGDMNVPIPAGPPFFRFSDMEESRRLLAGAGFTRLVITELPQVWQLSSPDVLFEVLYNASVRNAALLRAQTPEVLDKIRAEVRTEVERAGCRLPMPAVLAAGHKLL